MVNNLFERGTDVQSSDYKSAGSHQVEVLSAVDLLVGGVGSYHAHYTVPSTKTFYCTAINVGKTGTNICYLATGASGSEVDFFMAGNSQVPEFFPFPTPIKFSAGTEIRTKINANAAIVTLVGWLEG